MIEFRVTGVEAAAQYAEQYGRGVPVAMARALNRAIAHGRTLTRRQVAQDTRLKQKAVSRSLRIRPATPGDLEARLQAIARRIPLIAYLDIRGGLRSGTGVGGRAYGLGTIPAQGFYAKMPSGHRGVYARLGRSRLPIRELTGPTIPEVILRRRIFEAMQGPVQTVYTERLLHELERLSAKAA